MPFSVEMTGVSDYGPLIKMAVAGFPGAGKTLFASTAPEPLFVFFREQPRMMSLARRYMPHVKLTNQVDDTGKLVPGGAMHERLQELLAYLHGEGAGLYETVVLDTADEMFQALKEAKKIENHGKFGRGDWGWLADIYREIVNGFIDLPMHTVALFHVKQSQEGEDGQMTRELALQGQAKDEAAGWFDIVAVLDSYEAVDDQGVKSTRRAFLTQSTPMYAWPKDHSGQMPRLWDLSEDFVGDFERLHGLVYDPAALPKAQHALVKEILDVVVDVPNPAVKREVPSPTDVEEKIKSRASLPEVKRVEEDVSMDEAVENVRAAFPDAEEPEPTQTVAVPESRVNTEPLTPMDAAPAKSEPESTQTDTMSEEVPSCVVCQSPIVTQVYDSSTGEAVLDGEGNQKTEVYQALIDVGLAKHKQILCVAHLKEANSK